MAIASGLTCVDYLATKYHPQNFKLEDFRYSPTFHVDELFTTILSQQQQQQQQQHARNAKTTTRCPYQFTSDAPPVLEFTNLSLVEDEVSFALKCNNNTGHTKNIEFSTECKKMRRSKCRYQQENQACDDDRIACVPLCNEKDNIGETPKPLPITLHDVSTILRQQNIVHLDDCDSSNICSDDDDDEIGLIFHRMKPSFDDDNYNSISCKSNSSTRFHGFQPRFNTEDCDHGQDLETVSESEQELSAIMPGDLVQGSKINTRKRSSSTFDADTRFKRPCINAEKMHRSLIKRRRNHVQREMFVPISTF